MIKFLRTVGYLEAVSFLALLCVAMPLKYYYGMLDATRIPGMVHGLLFLFYVMLATYAAASESWPKKKLWLAYLASVLPLGTLVYDRQCLQDR